MNKYQKQKIENVKNMMKSLFEIYKKMKDSPLKKDYNRYLYLTFSSNNSDLKLALEYIEKRIKMYKTSTTAIYGLKNEYVVKFWKNVKNIIKNTYFDNKNLK